MSAVDVEYAAPGKHLWQSEALRRARSATDTARSLTAVLDRIIPLDGASHADVDDYTVEIPMRYAACFAILRSGRKVPLRDARKFLGWSGWQAKRTYLFRSKGLLVEVRTNPELDDVRAIPGKIYDVVVRQLMPGDLVTAASNGIGKAGIRKFIAPDGTQILLTDQQQTSRSDVNVMRHLL
jgi:hypothetical protein